MNTYKDKYIKYKKKYLYLKNKISGGRLKKSKFKKPKFKISNKTAKRVSKNITIWFLKKANMDTTKITWKNFKEAVITTFKIFKVKYDTKFAIMNMLNKTPYKPSFDIWWSIAILILTLYENDYISTQKVNELLEIK